MLKKLIITAIMATTGFNGVQAQQPSTSRPAASEAAKNYSRVIISTVLIHQRHLNNAIKAGDFEAVVSVGNASARDINLVMKHVAYVDPYVTPEFLSPAEDLVRRSKLVDQLDPNRDSAEKIAKTYIAKVQVQLFVLAGLAADFSKGNLIYQP